MNQFQLLLVQSEIGVLLAFLMFIQAQRLWDAPMGSHDVPWLPMRDASRRLQFAICWMIHNIGSPGLCFAAIAGGVLCANHLAWEVVGLAVMQPLPLIEVAPGADLVLAVLVFNRGGYRRWQASAAIALLPRMLAVFGLGFTWPLVVGRQMR